MTVTWINSPNASEKLWPSIGSLMSSAAITYVTAGHYIYQSRFEMVYYDQHGDWKSSVAPSLNPTTNAYISQKVNPIRDAALYTLRQIPITKREGDMIEVRTTPQTNAQLLDHPQLWKLQQRQNPKPVRINKKKFNIYLTYMWWMNPKNIVNMR